MKLARHPVVLVWLTISIIMMVLSVLVGFFVKENQGLIITSILVSQAASSIFFPIVVGYFYDRIKEKES